MRLFEFSDLGWGALRAKLEIERDQAEKNGSSLTIPAINLKAFGVSDADALVKIKNQIDPDNKLFTIGTDASGEPAVLLKTKSKNPNVEKTASGKGFSVDDMASSAASKAISQK